MNGRLRIIYNRGQTSERLVPSRDFAYFARVWRGDRWLRCDMRRGFANQSYNGHVVRGYQRP